MGPAESLSLMLGWAVLLPLFSFAAIALFGNKLERLAGTVATGSILLASVLSFGALGVWLTYHYPAGAHHAVEGHGEVAHAQGEGANHQGVEEEHSQHQDDHASGHEGAGHHEGESDVYGASGDGHDSAREKVYYAGYWYRLGEFGSLHLDIGYYIDSLTMCMFCMVTLIATCIHFYATGYMHDELHDYTDHEVTLEDGSHLRRPGRYHRFFQYMSLFCFSMLGLVISGNIAMTFVFWELVGICSYFLIGFYVERHSASTAANKAFIVNRVGDFGMLIGLMVLWTGLGTFNFGDVFVVDEEGKSSVEVGMFSLMRPADADHQLVVPDGMVLASARHEATEVAREYLGDANAESAARVAVIEHIDEWREDGHGYWLMIIAGVGIFCGCVGKSAQFPLHTWLPDAMEGPTPVSALVHSATMVAAGVFLVGRFYPVFVPEVLLVIAVIGCITLFMAATIAITATDIKRVLAYSTVSQLGYMMLALGVGGWLPGMWHLITHAFFKSLLFLCSGSVIHAVHTNEMTEMGGLRKKMPWTAYTMLIGCLAIAGAGLPFVVGFSGYYSKDSILEQAFSFQHHTPFWGTIFFVAAALGAAVTSFYMFRLWYMTFAGEPRDTHRYDHAHESSPVMFVPLVILSVFAVTVAWGSREGVLGSLIAILISISILCWIFFGRVSSDASHSPSKRIFTPLALSALVFVISVVWSSFSLDEVTLNGLLAEARPMGTLSTEHAKLIEATWPNEHESHEDVIRNPVTLIASGTALCGFFLATVFYGLRYLEAADLRQQFYPIYRFLLNKWWFDELYDWIFVRPVHLLSRLVAGFDQRWIDGFLDGLARLTVRSSNWGNDWIDRGVVDGLANAIARWTHATGLSFRRVQTGSVRQYVMFIVVGTVAIFILISLFWSRSMAG